MVLFPHRQTYNIESIAPRLKHLLFHRAEYQTTELSSACQKVVLTNLLNCEGMCLALLSDSGIFLTL